MTEVIFCNVENRPFKDDEFFTDKGITIHILTETKGHTLDGWPATFEHVNAESSRLVGIKIGAIPVPNLAMEKFE